MRTGKKVVLKDSRSVNAEARIIPVEYIERRIFLLREQKVMLDSDLAELYQVTTGNLNLAVKRNLIRFPADFMFQLTKNEAASLLLQFARAKGGRGYKLLSALEMKLVVRDKSSDHGTARNRKQEW
jgi:ORF6N domain